MPGRCEGCGRTGSPCKIKAHILECESWQAIYARDPALALGPEESYAAWMGEGKTAARIERKAELAGREVVLREAADARWATPPDILED